MKNSIIITTVFLCSLAQAAEQTNGQIMQDLNLDPNGKTEVVKDFPDSFPGALTARGEPIVYTKENSENFEYIGMPVGGICAGQLYLGGDGQLWFWDIFNEHYRIRQIRGEKAYEFPYKRSEPNVDGARMIDQGFSIRVQSEGQVITKRLNRDGIEDIEFLGQYPIGEVTYRDAELPLEVKLEAYSPFIPLDLDSSILPATIMTFTVENTSAAPVEAELSGWMENPVFIASRRRHGVNGTLANTVTRLPQGGARLHCTAIPEARDPSKHLPNIRIVPERALRSYKHEYWTVSDVAVADEPTLPGKFKREIKTVQKLVTPAFPIERPIISCKLGGSKHSERAVINILVDGKVVASGLSGRGSTEKHIELNVRDYLGRDAVIEFVNPSFLNWGRMILNDVIQTDGVLAADAMKELPDFGTLSLTLLGDNDTLKSEPEHQQQQDLRAETSLVGRLTKSLQLGPGEKQSVTFIVTWHFPTTLVLREQPNRRYYATVFDGAESVSDYIVQNFDRLESTTRLWRDTWYESTLPFWFLDRTFLNASILASSTSNLLKDRLFYGWEGGYQGAGTCTHVWGYVQAMGRLFPELEKSLREQVDFRSIQQGGAMDEHGLIRHRWFSHDLAVDGQSGCILRAYLCHQMSKDDTFLKGIYAGMKKAMVGLTEARDGDHDGILTGAQHNTLDAAWYGKITWLSLHYTAALRAMAAMADDMGDSDYAQFCRQTADKGRTYIEEHLFNGEYFYHEADPDRPQGPGTYTGLEYSQLLGQSWAYQVGLGQIIDPAKTKTALESIWRYNFTTDVGPFREVHTGGRWYAMPGEGGLIACTWPRGGSEVLDFGSKRFADYNNECQNGYEYAATSLMMWHDMPHHSLAHIWYMHNDRYHGSKRNPWCEIEWGLHYSRSMASYGHFVGVCGFEYHGPKGSIAFSPKITPENFKAPVVTAEGWGTFEQKRAGDLQSERITLKHGQLDLQEMAFDVAKGWKIEDVQLFLEDVKSPVTFEQDGARIRIHSSAPIQIASGQTLRIELKK